MHSDEHESLLTIVDAIEHNQKDVGKVIGLAERRVAIRLERKRLAILKETEQIIDALLDEHDAHDIVHSLDASLYRAGVSHIIGNGYSDGVIADYDDVPVDPRSYGSLPEIDASFFHDGYNCPGNAVAFKGGRWVSNKLGSKNRDVNAIINHMYPNLSKAVKELTAVEPRKVAGVERSSPRYKWRFFNHFYRVSANHTRLKSLQEVLEVVTVKGESWFDMLSIEHQHDKLTLVVTLYDKSQFYFDLMETDNQEGCYVFDAKGRHATDQQKFKSRCKDLLWFTATLETIAVSFDDMASIRDNKNRFIDDLQIFEQQINSPITTTEKEI